MHLCNIRTLKVKSSYYWPLAWSEGSESLGASCLKAEPHPASKTQCFSVYVSVTRCTKRKRKRFCVTHHRQYLIVLSCWFVTVRHCALFVCLGVIYTNRSFAVQADRDRVKAMFRVSQHSDFVMCFESHSVEGTVNMQVMLLRSEPAA